MFLRSIIYYSSFSYLTSYFLTGAASLSFPAFLYPGLKSVSNIVCSIFRFKLIFTFKFFFGALGRFKIPLGFESSSISIVTNDY